MKRQHLFFVEQMLLEHSKKTKLHMLTEPK